MKKLYNHLLIIVLVVPILGGCWNQKELTDLAFVMAMGVDKGEDKRYEVSFQLVNPGNVASGQNGGSQQGLPIAVYKASGNTVTEAARQATKTISRRLYYAHTNLLAVSEEVAKDGILDIIDGFDRDPEFRTTTEIVVTRNTTAEELVSSLTNLDKIPVNKITKELKSTEEMLGENMSLDIDNFIDSLTSNGKQPVLNGYSVVGDKRSSKRGDSLQKTETDSFLAADGLAVFRAGKLVGWISGEKARGVVWILNKVKSTAISISWNGKKNAIVMVPIRSKTKVGVSFKQGRPIINIKVEDEGWISEANTAVNLNDPLIMEKIDIAVEKEIKKQIMASVREAQKFKADIFGFGDLIHRQNPKLWDRIKSDWDEQFANLEVNVKVDSYARKEGIRTKPFWTEMKW